jgi:dUTPase
MNMTNEENIDPLLDIENADFLELSASQEEILVKSLQRASTETHTLSEIPDRHAMQLRHTHNLVPMKIMNNFNNVGEIHIHYHHDH